MAEEEEDELNQDGREMVVCVCVCVCVRVRWGGGASLRSVLKKTKAAQRRRVQCADYRGHVYARPTNTRDILSTCMETF